jgi:type II secretory pathway pseudopilin PulG
MTDPNTAPPGCSRGFVISVIIVFAVAACLAGPLILQLREDARRQESRNRLKQLGLALHNYHDTFRCFPPGGIFNEDGVAFHCWTSSIAPYLDSSPWYNQIDFRIPWDDPRQLDLFRDWNRQQSRHWTNPSVSPVHRKDGLVFNHYAGSQTIFYRNSSVSIQRDEIDSRRLLMADAFDHHIPVGFPYAWRDVALGFMTNPDGFGCRPRKFTQCVMGDGSVRAIAAMMKPSEHSPTTEQVAKPQDYPLIDVSRIWRIEWVPDEDRRRGKRDLVRRIPPKDSQDNPQ